MDWTSWSLIWSTNSTTPTSRKLLKRRRKYLRWRHKYLRLQADQRLKQNREDLPLLVHFQELYLFFKEHGLILNQESIRSSVPSGKKTKHSSSSWSSTSRRRWGDWILEIKRLSSERICALSTLVWWNVEDSTDPSGQEILYLRALQGHSGRNPIEPTLQDNVSIPNNFFEYIYHIGCAVSLHSITNSGLIAGGQNSSREWQMVFFTAVTPMNENHKDPQELDLTKPRLALYKQKWKKHQDTVYWVDFQLAQQKGLKFYQTRSNAIILCDTLPAYCISKVVVMKSKELI